MGEDGTTPGEVAFIGGRLSKHAAAEFAALQMGTNPLGDQSVEKVLLVRRPVETDKRVTALASAEGVDSISTGGLPECARPREWFAQPIPAAAVDSIIEWIDVNAPAHTRRAVPQYLTTVTMPAEGPDGADVVESIERIEPNGLFAIRTMPGPRDPAPAKTVLFFVTAIDSHLGPAREWVAMSRCIAAAGAQAVRWDLAGVGLSGEVSRDPWRRVYTKADIADSIAVARHACREADELELVGICSGSWYAAQAGRHIGAQSVILVNLYAWNWRVTPTLLMQWSGRRKAQHAIAAIDTAVDTRGGPAETGTARLKALVNRARQATISVLHNHLPRSILRLLSWIGLVWLPEDVLRTLAHRGTAVTVIASPEDAEQFTAKGGRAALERLQETSRPPRLIATSTGDHAANHPAILAAIRSAVLPATAVSPTEHTRMPARLTRARRVGAQ